MGHLGQNNPMQPYVLGTNWQKKRLCRKGSEGPGGQHVECASQQAKAPCSVFKGVIFFSQH